MSWDEVKNAMDCIDNGGNCMSTTSIDTLSNRLSSLKKIGLTFKASGWINTLKMVQDSIAETIDQVDIHLRRRRSGRARESRFERAFYWAARSSSRRRRRRRTCGRL